MSSFLEYLKYFRSFCCFDFYAYLAAYFLASLIYLEVSEFRQNLDLRRYFDESCMLCKHNSWSTVIYSVILFDVSRLLCEIFRDHCFFEYRIHVLLFDSLLWDSHKVSSYQFFWKRTIVYRVLMTRFLFARFQFLLQCFDSDEMFW